VLAPHRREDAKFGQVRHPAEDLDRAGLDRLVGAHLAGRQGAEYGRWVHYPWSGRLVHLLAEDELRELRSNRNRDKITAEEQAQLRTKQARILESGLRVAAGRGGGTEFDSLREYTVDDEPRPLLHATAASARTQSTPNAWNLRRL